jgi:SOS-response transcriptional repressor LexA
MTETALAWVKRRMREKGLKQVDLANALGLMPNKISKTFAGERQFKAPEMDILRDLLREDEPTQLDGTIAARRIPVIGSVAAGNWREAIQQPLGTIGVPDEETPDDAVGLRVVGDSMDKIVGDGGTVIFSPSDRALYPDRYYVVINGQGETTFKQFKADPARLVPASNNPDHKEIIIGEGETFQIVGRVTGFHGRL